jgi:hypothetical protein
VRDKGSVRRNVPYLMQAVKQGFQAGTEQGGPGQPMSIQLGAIGRPAGWQLLLLLSILCPLACAAKFVGLH